jgi:hypothetical protein
LPPPSDRKDGPRQRTSVLAGVLRTRSPDRVLAGVLRTRSSARVLAGERGYSRVPALAWYSTRPGPPAYSRACGASPPPRGSAGRGGGPGKTPRRHHPTARAGTRSVNAGAYYRGTPLACNPRTRGCAAHRRPPAYSRVWSRTRDPHPAGNSRVAACPPRTGNHGGASMSGLRLHGHRLAAAGTQQRPPPRTIVTRVGTEGEASRHGSRDKS